MSWTQESIVLVLGLTGVGKSTFIERAAGQNNNAVGHGWKSYTPHIQPVKATHPSSGHPFVFVDTPGFDDTYKSDTEVLAMIAKWLAKSLKKKAIIAAILYLHRITDNRMSGTAMKNLRLLSSICGQKAMPRVIIVTTMWSKVREQEGSEREEALKREVWEDMLGNGCSVARFENTRESAWHIVGSVRQKDPGVTLLIQEEMVHLRKPLYQTQAGIDTNTAAEIVFWRRVFNVLLRLRVIKEK